jgi:hypothetical protein
MITLGEMSRGVYGAWRLARRDPAGLAFIDASERGFWHSFWAAALVAPAYFALGVLDGDYQGEALRPLLVQGIAYVIGWVAFPLAMVHISDGLGRGGAFFRYMTAYNWSAVVQMAVYLPMAVIAHLAPTGGLGVFTLAITLLLLFYQVYIAHIALAVPPLTAAGIVVFDMMLGGMVQMTAERLMK